MKHLPLISVCLIYSFLSAQSLPKTVRSSASPWGRNARATSPSAAQPRRLWPAWQFIPNKGEMPDQVRYVATTTGQQAYITSNEISIRGSAVSVRFVGAQAALSGEGENPLPGQASFITGNNPERWQTNLPLYGAVKYRNLYPGVDLTIRGEKMAVESRFAVAAGTDPSVIQVTSSGIDTSRLRTQAWQMRTLGRRSPVNSELRVFGENTLGVVVGEHDTTKPLFISILGLLGDTQSSEADGSGVVSTTDADGNTYLTGRTGAVESDVFAAKLTPDGILQYLSFFGGAGDDEGLGIAAGLEGAVYITGRTNSSDFPTASPLQQTLAGGTDAFLVKLDPSGGSLIYATYLGGKDDDYGQAVAVEKSGNAYLTGATRSTDFPVVAGSFQTASGGKSDAFATKVNAQGSALLYSTHLGGEGDVFGTNITVDQAGDASVTVIQDSITATQTTPAAVQVLKLNASGTGLLSRGTKTAAAATASALIVSANATAQCAGNGVADDTACLQSAINATPAGGTLTIPAGTFRISSTLNLLSSRTYTGTGNPVILGYQGNGAGGFPLMQAWGSITNVTVSNITFDGGGLAMSPNSGIASGITITGNTFRHIQNTNPFSDDQGHAAIFLDGPSGFADLTITFNTFLNITYGNNDYIDTEWIPAANADWDGSAIWVKLATRYDINDNTFTNIGMNAIKMPLAEVAFAQPGPYNIKRNTFNQIHRIPIETQQGFTGSCVSQMSVDDNVLNSFVAPYWSSFGLSIVPWCVSDSTSGIHRNKVYMTPAGPANPPGGHSYGIGIETGIPIVDSNILQSANNDPTGPGVFVSILSTNARLTNNQVCGPYVSRPNWWSVDPSQPGSASVDNTNTYTNTCSAAATTTITQVSANPTASGATITWTTDHSTTSQVSYGTTTAYGNVTALNATLVTNHSVVLSGLPCGTLDHYKVTSTDAGGANPTSSGDFTFTTSACQDTVAPSVSISTPSGSQTVSGTIAISATASDNVGVVGVQFLIDGTRINPEVITAPWVLQWNSANVGNGAHTLTSVARDAAGNTATSAGVPITVQNAAPPVSQLVSDDFHSPSLNTTLWTFVNPLNDGSVSLNGTDASITVPGGTSHDVWTTGNFAPRIMQSIPNVDFEVEVKFDSRVTSAYQMQGILVEQDSSNYLRFDVYYDGASPRLFSAGFVNNNPTVNTDTPIAAGMPLWLKLKRTGNTWTGSWSNDGTSYTAGVTFNQTLSVTKAGLFAGNCCSSAPAFTAQIDHFFNTASPIVPEDGGPPGITLGAVTTTGTGATVPWTTTRPTTSQVSYGTTTAYGNVTALNSTLVANHSVVLSGLSCGAVYHYKVSSANIGGADSASSGDFTFTTKACAGGAGPVSDNFNANTLNTSLWTFVNPLGDGSYSMNGSAVLLNVPGGVAHDVWTGSNKSVALKQSIGNTDFGVEVKFDSAVTQQYQMQGIIVEQDSGTFVRFDVYHDGSTPRLFAASFSAGNPTVRGDSSISSGGAPFWLRVQRTGNTWTQSWSTDGVNFHAGATFTFAMAVARIGPFAANNADVTTSSPAFTEKVSYFFNMASPLTP
jgi:regulation of enolase protein 1 (concanavalin A-like superfamily)